MRRLFQSTSVVLERYIRAIHLENTRLQYAPMLLIVPGTIGCRSQTLVAESLRLHRASCPPMSCRHVRAPREPRAIVSPGIMHSFCAREEKGESTWSHDRSTRPPTEKSPAHKNTHTHIHTHTGSNAELRVRRELREKKRGDRLASKLKNRRRAGVTIVPLENENGGGRRFLRRTTLAVMGAAEREREREEGASSPG